MFNDARRRPMALGTLPAYAATTARSTFLRWYPFDQCPFMSLFRGGGCQRGISRVLQVKSNSSASRFSPADGHQRTALGTLSLRARLPGGPIQEQAGLAFLHQTGGVTCP